MTTKRCNRCQLVKSTSEFNRHITNSDRLKGDCKSCQQKQNVKYAEIGSHILQNLAVIKGCCNQCQRPYQNEDWHFFEFDHIDPKLKKFNKETSHQWISCHQQEFLKRVVPNLQLLCIKCHKLKTSQEMKLGGSVHQKKYGQSKPAQVIQRDLTLFDSAITLESHETYTLHACEGQWVTVRDIDGNLIRYEPYSNYIKQ